MALRERAVAAYERGDGSYMQVAALFDLDHRTLERWVARWRDTGSVAPRPRGGGWPCPIELRVLRAVVGDVPDATVSELRAAYNRRVPRAQRTSRTSFHRALRREGFVLKKNARDRVRSTGPTSTRSDRRT
jgi:transposase